jgi:hypothetical protein
MKRSESASIPWLRLLAMAAVSAGGTLLARAHFCERSWDSSDNSGRVARDVHDTCGPGQCHPAFFSTVFKSKRRAVGLIGGSA